MASFHPVEASFNHIIATMETVRTEWFLALRAITQKPLQYFLERAEDFSEHQPNYGADENTKDDFVYDSADYKSIFNLVVLHDKWGAAEHQFRAFVTFFFIKCLRQANYFHSKISNGESNTTQNGELTKEEQLIGSTLLALMSSACLNAHDLFQYESPFLGSWFVGDVRGLGQAFCPALALVNHSCDPNSIHFNVAHASVSVAVRNITKGEEIVECYYGFYGGTHKATRQAILLERYKFNCYCMACELDWPTLQGLTTREDSMKKTTQIQTTVDVLKSNIANKHAIQAFKNSIQSHKQANGYDRILKLLADFSSFLQDNVMMPNYQIVHNTQDFYKCLWIMKGSKLRVECQG